MDQDKTLQGILQAINDVAAESRNATREAGRQKDGIKLEMAKEKIQSSYQPQ